MQKSKTHSKIQSLFFKIWPIIIVIFIWFIFSYPYFLKGKMPYSATYQANNFAPWDAYPNLRGPIKNGAMPDVTTQIYPWKHFTIETWKLGQVPLWNPYSFGGSPHLANYQSAVLSPFNLLFFVLPFRDAWSVLILLQPLLAGIFMYVFLRSLSISKAGSLFSAISFMFCGFITVWMDYGTLAYAILFLPLAFFAIEKFYITQKIRYLLLLAISIPLSFFSGHFQISIYFFLTIFVYQIYKYFQIRNIRTAVLLLSSTFSGVLLSLPQILPSLEFYSQSLRSNIFQKGEVIPWGYLPTFIAPDFFGNPVTRNDWFGHYAEWNAYIGVVPLMLGFYSLRKKNAYTLFLFILALVVLLFAFQTPILDVFIALHIPVLSTSAASRIIVIFSFLFITLAGFGFDALLQDIKKKNNKPIHILIISWSLVFAILWLCIFLKLFIPLDKISIAKQNFILPTAIFLTAIGSLVIVLLGAHFRNRSIYMVLTLFSFAFICIVSFDMLRFATKWQTFDPKQLAYIDVSIAKFFPQIAGFERVIGNFGAESAVYYHLPSLEGYDALYISRYGEFIASLPDGKIKDAERSVVTFSKNDRYTPKVINLLNIKYIVHKVSDDYTSWTFPYWKYPADQFQKIYDDGSYRIYKNSAVFPRAFLVDSYVTKTNPQDIFSTMFANNFDLHHQIVLEKNPGLSQSQNKNIGSAAVIAFMPNKMEIAVDAKSDELLFTPDPYYQGWQAMIDGKQTEILRADFAFRAIKIPQGKHTVIFQYKPFSFILGIYFAAGGLICMIILLALPLFRKRKK